MTFSQLPQIELPIFFAPLSLELSQIVLRFNNNPPEPKEKRRTRKARRQDKPSYSFSFSFCLCWAFVCGLWVFYLSLVRWSLHKNIFWPFLASFSSTRQKSSDKLTLLPFWILFSLFSFFLRYNKFLPVIFLSSFLLLFWVQSL